MKNLVTTLAAAVMAVVALPASAQSSWPTKPIKAVVPFAAGAATDTVARTVLEQVAKQLGQAIIVENRPGAGGTIGEALVARSDPDG